MIVRLKWYLDKKKVKVGPILTKLSGSAHDQPKIFSFYEQLKFNAQLS